jgi:hypothetical protein
MDTSLTISGHHALCSFHSCFGRDGDVVDRMGDKSPIQQNSLDTDVLSHDIHPPSGKSIALT